MNRKVGLIFAAVVGTIGLLCVLLATILGWAVIPNIIENRIEDEVTLEEGTETWDKWQNVPYPVQFRVYVWHVENPKLNLSIGEKPKLKRVGPYVYTEKREKVDIQYFESDDTIEYHQRISYTFSPALSAPGCKDHKLKNLNIVNTPFISASMGIYRMAPQLGPDIVQNVLAAGEEDGENFVRENVSVDEMMFEGFELRGAYKMIIGLLPTSPVEFTGNRFAYYNTRNGKTEPEKYKIKSGKTNSLDFGRIVEWDNKLILNHWKVPDWLKNVTNPTLQNAYCNMINGTAGEIYRPFIKKDMTLRIYQTEICRSLHVVYQRNKEHAGIPGYLFSMPPDFYEWPHINENNWCFCTSPGQFSEEYPVNQACSKGVIRLGPCKYDSPVVTSNPAFLYANEDYPKMVEGVTPNEEDPDEHRTTILLEPNSGSLLQVSKKLQINIEMQELVGIPYFQNVSHFLWPAFYVDEFVEMDEYWTDDLKSKLINPLKLIKILKWTVLGIGCVLIGLATVVFIFAIRKKSKGYV